MNITEWLFVISNLIGLAGALIALIFSKKTKISIYSGFISAIIASSLILITAISGLIGNNTNITLFNTFFGVFGFKIDRLGSFFLIVISILTIPVSIYSLDYVQEYSHDYNVGLMSFLYNVFLLSMYWVVTVNNAIFFLIVWELMSLVSYLLVIYENKQNDKVFAGTLYVVMTHFGTIFIIISFFIMGSKLGSYDFTTFSLLGVFMPDNLRNALFIMLLIGFGTKAGIMPLHVWLPYAHPAAPSNISSLMSGVMIKVAILMLVRTIFEFLGIKCSWWGLVLIILGTISAVFGVMYATVERDIKQVLAFSSVENIGIIFIGLGACVIFFNLGYMEFGGLALLATLFHVLNHSMFKGLLFMGAGSILYSTHTKNIESLGGLIKKMPQTSIYFFIAVLSICAIPPFNGFVSEWLIMQSLLLSFNVSNSAVQVIFPLVVGASALVGGFVIACFTRLFGTGFLALPRSEHAEHAHEVPTNMRVGMAIVAILCVLTGVLSSFIIPVIDSVTSSITGISVADSITNGFIIYPILPTFVDASPILITILLSILIPVTWVVVDKIGGKQKVEYGDSWDCGTPLTPRNEYTATAFAQPINRVFGGIYRHDIRVVTRQSSSPYIFASKVMSNNVREPTFEKYLYIPLVNGVKFLSNKIRTMQNGNLMTYMGYIFITLVLVLIIFG